MSEVRFDDVLSLRLPLPLAQLYRRAHNAKSVQERHHAAFYLWESSLKLLGAVAVGVYATAGRTPDADLAQSLQNLARPSLGHWWEIVRRLTVELASAGNGAAIAGSNRAFDKLRELLLGRMRDDLPRTAGLDAALLATLDGTSGSRSTVRLTELFDRLVRYRNREFGHGAIGQRHSTHYDELGRALLSGVAELLGRLDVLAGHRLIYVADVRMMPGGAWLIERYELTGEAPRRLESFELPGPATTLLPQRVYLEDQGGQSTALLPLHPLLIYEYDSNEALFLNARRGQRRVEYLGYTTGRVLDRVEPGAQHALLAQLLNMPVDSTQLAAWQDRSQAEESKSGAADSQAPAELPQRLGEFELLSELGRGGMGVVYRAWQPSLGRQVALKCLLRLGDPRAEARFAREIAALGRVEHAHVVRIFTSGSEGDRWFYAMELVEGATLAAVCDRLHASGSSARELNPATWQQVVSTVCEATRQAEKPLTSADSFSREPPASAVSEAPGPSMPALAEGARLNTAPTYVRHVAGLMRQIADATQALHEQRIIHRDIKPGNILVDPQGTQATLMDLGLAQLADDEQGRLTRTRQFVGTLRYASPEQVLAVGKLKPASDVYSLGATLWELLALQPIFGAGDAMPTPQLMQKIQYEEPARIRTCNPAVPRDLAAIIDMCLRKDPRQRYATARELADDLDRFQEGQPVRARPVTGAERAWMWVRRNPVVTMLLTALAASLVAGIVAFLVKFADAREQADIAGRRAAEAIEETNAKNEALKQVTTEKDAKDKEADAKDKALRKVQEHLANASILLAQSAFERNDTRLANELLDRVPAEQPLALRRFEWHYLKRRFDGGIFTLHGHTWHVTSVAFSPDGTRLATGSEDNTVRLWDAHTGAPVLVLKGHTDHVKGVAFSPDSTRLASAGDDDTVRLWDTRSGALLSTLKGHFDKVWSVAYSPDGKRIASASQDKTVRIWDVRTGNTILELKGHSSTVTGVAFSPDGTRLASSSTDLTVRIWDARTGESLFELKGGHESYVDCVAFSPDGTVLASGGHDMSVRIWDAHTGARLAKLKTPQSFVAGLAFSPDGTRLASVGATLSLFDMDTYERVLELGGHTETVTSVAFSPDGKRLLTGSEDNTARLWDAGNGTPLLELIGHTNSLRAVGYRPDGKRVATGSEDHMARVWDAHTGVPVLTLGEHGGPVTCLAYSSDGSVLVTGTTNLCARMWDAQTGALVREFKVRGIMEIVSLALSRDGKRLATAGNGGNNDGSVQVWDTQKGTVDHEFKTTGLNGIAFSPDGARLATGHVDMTARLWDAATGSLVRELAGHIHQVAAVAFSPDGALLATGSWDKTVRLWDAHSGAPLLVLKGHGGQVTSVAFTPDSTRLASGSLDNSIRIWDTQTGTAVLELKGHSVNSLAFSPDGTRLIAGSDDGSARIWDARSSPASIELEHTLGVTSVAFSSDSTRLATGSKDKCVCVWKVPSGELVFKLEGHTDFVLSADFSPDATTLVSRSPKETIVWDLKTGKALPDAHPPEFTGFAPRTSPDGRWAAVADRTRLRLVDLRQALDPIELETRLWATRFDPSWHTTQNRRRRNEGDWFGALFHVNRLLEAGGDASLLKERRLILDEAVKRDPKDAAALAARARLLVAAGEINDYHQTCTALSELAGDFKDETLTRRLAITCLLAPDALKELKPLTDAFKKSMSDKYPEDLRIYAGLLLRTGKAEEAVKLLDQARGGLAAPYEDLLLALACSRLSNDTRAKECLRRAVSELDGGSCERVVGWQAWLELQVLRHEAERAVAGSK